MFIAHGEKVRKHSKWILIAILVVIVPSFVALFTAKGPSGRSRADLPTVRGKPLDPATFEAAKQAVRDQYVISEGRRLPGGGDYDDAVTRQAVMRVVLLRKAGEMGVRVSEEALINGLRQQPAFTAENGEFNLDRYRQFLILLNNNGVSEERFQSLMRDQMTIGQLQNMIGDAAKVTPQEVELQYGPLHEKHWIELVRFDLADAKQKPVVSDEDAAKYFEQNKDRFKKPAQVKVRYARFTFDDARKNVKVTDAEVQEYYNQNLPRFMTWDTNTNAMVTNSLDTAKAGIREDLALLAAKRQVSETAQQFAIKLVPDLNVKTRVDFAKLAAEAGAMVGETDYFTQEEQPKGVNAGRSFRQAAFALSIQPEPPYSDPVLGEDGLYVLEYLDSKPERIPAFAEVKTEVVEQIQQARIYEATMAAGRQALDSLQKLIAEGKTFTAAAATLRLKVQSYGPFTVAGSELDIPGAAQISQSVLGLQTNAVSQFIQTATGGMFYQLKDRQPFDRAEFEKNKVQYERQLLARQRQALFDNWLGSVLQQEQVSLGRPRPVAAPLETAEPAAAQP